MSDKIEKQPPVPPFVTFVTSAVPMVFDNSMSYYEALSALWKYLQDTVDVINNNASVTEDFIRQVNELHDYVEHYFDNLDVQTEINNKLDSMVEDGSFQLILNNYVQPKLDALDQKITDGLATEADTRRSADNVLSSQIETSSNLLQAQINDLASGAPLVATSMGDMTDTTRIYVLTTDGHWYYYDGDSWEDGGIYQSEVIDPDDPTIAGKLDKQEILQSIAFTTEEGWVSTSNTIFPNPSGQHYEHTIITNVTGGEKYYLSGYSVNGTYPGARIFKSGVGGLSFITTTGQTFVDYEYTVPENYDGGTLYINGWVEKQGVDAKQKTKQSSSDYWTEYSSLKSTVSNINHQLCARRDADNVYFFKHGYKTNTDLTIWFRRKAMNSLMDFFQWSTSENTSDSVITTAAAAADRTVLNEASTDVLAPSIVYATTNINGDFPNYTSEKFTGGWHGYNDATTGTATATAREISCNLYVDGVEVTAGNYATGKELKLIIVNNLQGSNTEKSDGTGREIVQQKFIITMTEDSNVVTVESEIKALENIIYSRMYGIQMYRKATSDTCYIINSDVYHSPFTFASNVNAVGKAATGIKEYISSTGDIFTMNRDQNYELGQGYANKASYGVLVSGGKGYAQYVSCIGQDVQENGLALNENDTVRFKGYYSVEPTTLNL